MARGGSGTSSRAPVTGGRSSPIRLPQGAPAIGSHDLGVDRLRCQTPLWPEVAPRRDLLRRVPPHPGTCGMPPNARVRCCVARPGTLSPGPPPPIGNECWKAFSGKPSTIVVPSHIRRAMQTLDKSARKRGLYSRDGVPAIGVGCCRCLCPISRTCTVVSVRH